MSFLSGILGKKEEPIRNYQDFWTWFQVNEKTFFKVVSTRRNIEGGFIQKLAPKLTELRVGFYFLAGMADHQTAEVVFTADGTIKNIVFVEELVASAPRLDGWKFTALKPALAIEDVKIEMNGYSFDRSNLSFYAKEHEDYPDEIDIVIAYKNYREEKRKEIGGGIYIFLDNFLGELEFATSIDNMSFIAEANAEKELIPIEKLKAYLDWRKKEFLEKYQGERHDTENDSYASYEAEIRENGRKRIATINSTLMGWDSKASHPWFMVIRIAYNGDGNNGMPDDQSYAKMDELESVVTDQIRDADGYLNIGRDTGDNLREVYFACNEFRKPSRVMDDLVSKYVGELNITFDIYKDKYWQTLSRFV